MVFFFPLTFCLSLSRCLGTPVIYISNCLSVTLSPPLSLSICLSPPHRFQFKFLPVFIAFSVRPPSLPAYLLCPLPPHSSRISLRVSQSVLPKPNIPPTFPTIPVPPCLPICLTRITPASFLHPSLPYPSHPPYLQPTDPILTPPTIYLQLTTKS